MRGVRKLALKASVSDGGRRDEKFTMSMYELSFTLGN